MYFDDNAYQDRKVVFCRHPFGEYANDLYSLKNIKPVVLFREPLDWLSSYYTKYGKKRFDTTGDLNTAFIDDALNKLKNYYMYWIDYSKKNDSKNFLFIKFSKLILEERDTFVKIFDFYGYDLKRVSDINYTEFKPSSVSLANYLIKNYDYLDMLTEDISTVSPIYLKKQ